MNFRRLDPRDRLQSFGYALRGIGTVLSSQPNTWIMGLATVVVVVAGRAFGVTRIEWCLLIIAMGIVWIAEFLNSGIEFLTDLATQELHPLARKAKDAAAGAVLLAAILAFLIAAFVFGPRILVIWNG